MKARIFLLVMTMGTFLGYMVFFGQVSLWGIDLTFIENNLLWYSVCCEAGAFVATYFIIKNIDVQHALHGLIIFCTLFFAGILMFKILIGHDKGPFLNGIFWLIDAVLSLILFAILGFLTSDEGKKGNVLLS